MGDAKSLGQGRHAGLREVDTAGPWSDAREGEGSQQGTLAEEGKHLLHTYCVPGPGPNTSLTFSEPPNCLWNRYNIIPILQTRKLGSEVN